MDIKVERFLKLNGCKKITDKEIIKVEDNYIYVKKSRDFLDTSYMVIDLEGNIIADRKCEYLKRDFFMINYCIYKKNKKIDKLQHVKIYDSFILGIFDDYMVLMDFDCNYISDKYDKISEFYNGVSVVLKDNKWGAIDTCGNVLVPPIYDRLSNFERKCATGKIFDEFVIIDTLGKIKNRFKIDASDIIYFCDNRFLVISEKKYYLIDENENIIYKSKKGEIFALVSNEQVIHVVKKNRKGNKIINQKDKYISIDNINHLSQFYNDVAIFYSDKYKIIEEVGLIDDSGVIIKTFYGHISHFYNDLFVTRGYDKNYGIIRSNGSILINCIYDNISIIGNYICAYKKDVKTSIFDLKGNFLFDLEKDYEIEKQIDNLFLIKRINKESAFTFFPKYYYKLIDDSNNTIIPEVLTKIFIIDKNRFIIDNCLVNLENEYLDMTIAYRTKFNYEGVQIEDEFDSLEQIEEYKKEIERIKKKCIEDISNYNKVLKK